ncbi:hypothetical protein E8E13_000310 [Curvularia kusanoi]|uniref:Uncharacterized protein n=1 Tax=Curvularia kusanoi TaxID=90978 RepID=A0A9P4W6W2_CURKU|nr:hypothetical protein E8E13_000310 [Curvularia kusanoi]
MIATGLSLFAITTFALLFIHVASTDRTSSRKTMSGTGESEIKGYVDTEILLDIHKYLCESANSDDAELAAWVKHQYLQEPFREVGRPIHNAEGYAQLNRAYRRVRLLTGKAQDKWPFFHETWKKMSATTVRNASLGVAVIGIPGSAHTGSVLTTSEAYGDSGQQDNGSNLEETPDPSDPAGQETEAYNKATSTDNAANSRKDSPLGAESSETQDSPDQHVRKSERNHFKRGPHIKYVKKSRTRAAAEGESSEEEYWRSFSEDVEASPSLVVRLQIGKDKTSPTTDALETNDLAAEDTLYSMQSTPTALAVEAEGVLSNLDRFPPGHRTRKRKSETAPVSPASSPVTKRLSLGSPRGMPGRPLRSQTHTRSPEEDTISSEAKASPSKISPQDASRRNSRAISTAQAEQSTAWDPAADVLVSGNRTDKRVHSSLSTDTKRKASILKKTPSPDSLDLTQGQGLEKSSKRVSFSPDSQVSSSEVQASKVQFFARITTSAGNTEEVSLEEEDLTSELDLIKRYAEWKDAGREAVSFNVFKDIVKFAR